MCKCVVNDIEYTEQQVVEGGLKVLQKKRDVYLYFPTLDNLMVLCEHCRDYSPLVREDTRDEFVQFNGEKFPVLNREYVSPRVDRIKTENWGHKFFLYIERSNRASKLSRIEVL